MEQNCQAKYIKDTTDKQHINKSENLTKIKKIGKTKNKFKKVCVHIWVHKIQEASMIMKTKDRILPMKKNSKLILKKL